MTEERLSKAGQGVMPAETELTRTAPICARHIPLKQTEGSSRAVACYMGTGIQTHYLDACNGGTLSRNENLSWRARESEVPARARAAVNL